VVCHGQELELETLAVWALAPVFATEPRLTPKRLILKSSCDKLLATGRPGAKSKAVHFVNCGYTGVPSQIPPRLSPRTDYVPVTDYTTNKHQSYPDVIVFDVAGKLDSTTSKFLLDCIEGHIDRGERKLVLDCSKLKYISSAGLESFIQTRKRLKVHGGTFAIAGVNGIVAEAIKLVHFDRLFKMFPTVDEAAQYLATEG